MRLLHLSKKDLNGTREYVWFTDDAGQGIPEDLEEDYPDLVLDWQVPVTDVCALPCMDALYGCKN